MSNVDAELPSGARVGLVAFGDPVANRLVVLCHPTPGAADFDPDPVVTSRWGVHVVALDLAGYGSSAPLERGRPATIGARAEDVAAFVRRAERNADRVSNADLTRFGVVGWGTGGLLAAAIAAANPDRVDRLALVGVPAPRSAERIARRALAAGRGIAALGVTEDDSDLARHLGLLRRLDRMLDAAYLHGDAGIRADLAMFSDDDGLARIPEIAAETRLWLGSRDPLVSERDIEWWGARIRGAKAQRIRDSGTLAISSGWARVLAHVAPQHGRIVESERDSGEVFLAEVDPVHPDQG